jgi:hypothetical protein
VPRHLAGRFDPGISPRPIKGDHHPAHPKLLIRKRSPRSETTPSVTAVCRISKLTNPSDENNTVDAILAQSPPLGLDIPEGTSFEYWLAFGKHLALADNALAWRIGDWWVYGEHRYGDRIAAVRTRGWNGPSFGACRNYAMVARAFQTSRRRDVLSFSHHREVASLSPADADQLLDWVGRTASQRRQAALNEGAARPSAKSSCGAQTP